MVSCFVVDEQRLGLTFVHEFGYTGNECSPATYHEDGQDHAGQHAAVHSHEIGELGVTFHVTWPNLLDLY